MTFDCLFVNGDSYSAPGQYRVYGDYLAERLNLPLVNLAVAGSNNDRILRSTMEYLENTDYKNPLVIVGWSFIRCFEVWYYGTNQKILGILPDQHKEEYKRLKFATLDSLIPYNELTLEEKVLINKDLFVHKKLMDFYTDLYLFSNLLRSKNHAYFFFSAARNDETDLYYFPALDNLKLVSKVKNDRNIYDLHNFFVQKWAQDNDPEANPVSGHLSPSGHKKFSDHLLKLLSL